MTRIIRLLCLLLVAGAATAFGGSRLPASDAAPAAEAGTFAAVILGPSSIRTYTQCVWTVNTSGGTAPYTYSWSVSNGSGSGDSEWYGEFYGNGTLYLTITDYNGQSVSIRKNVSASPGGPLCP